MEDDFRPPIAVDCPDCGKGRGVKTPHGNKCSCGNFAPEAKDYCLTHQLDYEGLFTRDNHCPKCREERRVEEMEMEMHERRADPRMHPSVDAPRW